MCRVVQLFFFFFYWGNVCAGSVIFLYPKSSLCFQAMFIWCLRMTSLCGRCSMPALRTRFTPRTTESTTSRCPAAGCDARMWVESTHEGTLFFFFFKGLVLHLYLWNTWGRWGEIVRINLSNWPFSCILISTGNELIFTYSNVIQIVKSPISRGVTIYFYQNSIRISPWFGYDSRTIFRPILAEGGQLFSFIYFFQVILTGIK